MKKEKEKKARKEKEKININLYLGSIKVKTIKREKPDDWDKVIRQDYKVTIIGHKEIFRNNIATTILRPTKLLMDPTDKEVDINCVIYGGANIE